MYLNPFRSARCDRKLILNRHPAYGKRPESIKPRYRWNGEWISCVAYSGGRWSEADFTSRERLKLVARNHHTVIVELADGRQVKRHIRKHRVLFEI